MNGIKKIIIVAAFTLAGLLSHEISCAVDPNNHPRKPTRDEEYQELVLVQPDSQRSQYVPVGHTERPDGAQLPIISGSKIPSYLRKFAQGRLDMLVAMSDEVEERNKARLNGLSNRYSNLKKASIWRWKLGMNTGAAFIGIAGILSFFRAGKSGMFDLCQFGMSSFAVKVVGASIATIAVAFAGFLYKTQWLEDRQERIFTAQEKNARMRCKLTAWECMFKEAEEAREPRKTKT